MVVGHGAPLGNGSPAPSGSGSVPWGKSRRQRGSRRCIHDGAPRLCRLDLRQGGHGDGSVIQGWLTAG
ncbi:hypothetical protein UCMB321_3611 [Pseudomonas batumici]|uniref:Uncharacterized protein n=1 Tax=Pseudomonas batumici TaxID=226910 RepID=A0A0C2EVE9_9PSED|nr:hypothetical protein UCMB321_3611 [Pseudomonas batumici]